MVQTIEQRGGRKLYCCEGCGSNYYAEGHAVACERWCAGQKSCNLDIMMFSVEDVRAKRFFRKQGYASAQ